MKVFSIFLLLILTITLFMSIAQAQALCDCNFKTKEEICGSNGVTYKNRCEFECTQRDYKKLQRTLNVAKMGHC
ncbi:serine protease inhibitor Kazal-type 9-like [Glossina fuscipes]|uniref:Serine protease inhibitor Kazal-type 9-like n=1 Tax=Glossina fuscipes TaxID=7396 RepID=A0A8U0WB31_9MUSC|nr:serine protease inhibitor Kazal-type 9-like [Glossina fuscipes]